MTVVHILRLISTYVLISTCALALSAVSAAAAERVKIPASTKWNGKAISLVGHFSRPGGSAKLPAVILMHGCAGLGPTIRASLNAHARVLNRNGFATLILDSFGPRKVGGGYVCDTLRRLADARSYRLADARDAAGWLKSQAGIDGRNIFLMGQSNGGSVALRAAARGGFRAVAAYYPWCGAATSNRSPLIVFGGGRDDWVPPDQCGQRRQTSKYTFVLYPKAAHSFDVRSGLSIFKGYRIGYNGSATRSSRAAMVAFFRKHMR